ncbi:MAG: hypothetical protein GKR91_04620 [Pseudomonadales bacterium]|nr:hypothetical protein [Pseudomonadales bacterium]
MNESQRKAYLNAMGIDVYYPRVSLPGAKLSPAYEFELEEEGQELPLDKDSSPTEETSRSSSQAVELVSDISPTAISPPPPTVEDKPVDIKPETITAQVEKEDKAKGTESDNDLRFALRYYKISDSLAVVDEYPLQQTAESKDESWLLLRNILQALNVELVSESIASEHFGWPLIEGFTDATDEATAAKQALQGFIAGRQQQDGFNNLLVFAGLVDDLLIGPEGTENRRDYQMTNSELFITITQSLQSMLSYPQLKKDVWHQLQSLRARIQASK